MTSPLHRRFPQPVALSPRTPSDRPRAISVVSLLALLIAAACGGGGDSPAPCTVSSVAVLPNAAALVVGGTVQLAANATAQNCSTIPAASWTSSATAVASVSASGLVTALTAGTSTITATVGGASSSAQVSVTVAPIATLEITPGAASVTVGGTVTLGAVAKDAQGNTLTGRTVTWTSLIPTVATVTAAGVVTGVSAGTGTVSATAEGRVALAVITVTPPPVATVNVVLNSAALTPGQTTQAVATLLDATGAALTGRATTWASSNSGVATVDAFGAVTAVAPGNTNISATSEGRSGLAALTVTQVPVAAISLAVTSASMRVGENQVATATARDANGNILAGRTIAWTTSNVAVATVTQGGVIAATGQGAVAITASSGGQFASVAITVTPNVASIDLTLATNPITAGQVTQATAVARDAGGSAVPGIAITFASSNQAAATISANGVITALAAGVTNISATAGAVNRSVALTVSAVVVPVATLTLAPAVGNLQVGGELQLTATVRDALGNTLTDRTITWTSSASAVASVSTAGKVTAIAPGNASITASVEGKNAAAAITVVAVPVGSVTVSTPSTSVSVGSTLQATAALLDANNVVVQRPVTWSSGTPAVATVSQTGLITALSAGSVTISASSEGKTGSVVITVLGTPTLSVVSFSPTSASTNVSIESVVQVTFSENINAATVTAGTVALSTGGVAVPATRTVSGKVVTITPNSLLAEFNAAYVVTITTSLKSSVGNSLPNNVGAGFTTVFWDPNYYYRLTNDFLGAGESLDTFSGGGYECYMGTTGGFTGQFWYFTPINGAPGYYTMQNQFGGPTRGLEGADSPGACFLAGPLVPGQFTGMMWKPVSAAQFSPGRYFLQSLNFGSAKSLDTPFLGTEPHPSMQPTGGFTGQFWTFTRLFHR